MLSPIYLPSSLPVPDFYSHIYLRAKYMNPQFTLAAAAAATEAMVGDTNPPKRLKKRWQVKDHSTGLHLEYNGETHWASKYSARRALARSIQRTKICDQAKAHLNLNYYTIESFIKEELNRGRFELTEFPA